VPRWEVLWWEKRGQRWEESGCRWEKRGWRWGVRGAERRGTKVGRKKQSAWGGGVTVRRKEQSAEERGVAKLPFTTASEQYLTFLFTHWEEEKKSPDESPNVTQDKIYAW
jgi:hypothetical protein